MEEAKNATSEETNRRLSFLCRPDCLICWAWPAPVNCIGTVQNMMRFYNQEPISTEDLQKQLHHFRAIGLLKKNVGNDDIFMITAEAEMHVLRQNRKFATPQTQLKVFGRVFRKRTKAKFIADMKIN